MRKLRVVFAGLVMCVVNAQSASWVVWPGQSVQTAITNASVGDNITIKEGIYVEDVVLDKGLDIRGDPGKELTTSVQGTWTIRNATAPIYLKGFKTGVSRDGSIVVTHCNDVRMDYITASPGMLTVADSKFYLYRSTISSNATFNGGQWTLQRSTVAGYLSCTNADTKVLASTVSNTVSHYSFAKECTVFQSNIGESLFVRATNYWIGYNSLRCADVRDGSGTCEIVGNRINLRASSASGLYIVNTSPYIRNNVITNGYFSRVWSEDWGSITYSNMCNGILVETGNPVIVNNVIGDFSITANNTHGNGVASATNCANGIVIKSGCVARVINNIVHTTYKNVEADLGGNGFMVFAPSSSEVKYSDLRGATGGGCVPTNCINADPMATNDFVLLPGSPCIGAGDPDPQFNDLDNTRNDMGCYGGHAYDPSGLTTTNPVVIRADASPLYIKRGQTIMLKARGAVSAD